MTRILRGLAALVTLAFLLVGAPLLLLLWIGNPWPPGGWLEVQLVTNATVYGAVAVIGWLAWAQMTLCILIEAAGVIRGFRPRRIWVATNGQQHLVRALITAVAALGVGATTLGVNPALADQGATPHINSPSGDHLTQQAARQLPQVSIHQPTTLWKLAEHHLGDGAQWRDILTLNRGTTLPGGQPLTQGTQSIPAGTTLNLPKESAAAAATPTANSTDSPGPATYRVEQGDTLWDISEDQLGDPTRYPELFEASTDRRQPGGDRLTDPDHIEPGWKITVPAPPGDAPPRGDDGPDRPRGTDDQRSRDNSTDQNPGNAQAAPQTNSADPPKALEAPADESTNSLPTMGSVAEGAGQESSAYEVSALGALLATAGCLGVGALGLLVANRRRQFRRRRIGRTIATTPDELLESEHELLEHGSKARESVVFLDRALRHVAASCELAHSPLPQLGAAVLGEEELTLLFTQPAVAPPPEGWTGTDDTRAWTLPRGTLLEEDLDQQPPPYPSLVSIGHDDDGRNWLLDLETQGRCGVAGAPEQVGDLARFMVAELAVNAWSASAEILLTDHFGAEMVGINPARLRQVGRSDALNRAAVLTEEMGEVEQNLGADLLTRRRDGLLLDSTNPVVVVVSTTPGETFVGDIQDRDRSRVVVVHRDERSPAIELASDGTAFLPMWGISVKAFTLSADEAGAMAALVASTRNLEDEPVPATQSDEGPLGPYARADGSLREDYTEPRHTKSNNPSSMLPDADEVYLATAATTTEDLAALAPNVPEEIRAEIAALDPTLDQDVTDWFDASSPRPKVHLLGPVAITARDGGDPTSINNCAGTVSFIAYLACQDHGVTGERAAAACGWKTQRTVQNRATDARYLLGTRPDGSDWLPDASMSVGARQGTSPTYELVRGPGGVLNSPDLFVRLKHRAARRGDSGCEEDLVTALSLVTGAPFEAATESRFKWLFSPGQQRHDEILVGAIHDAAHVLATRAVKAGRTDLVQVACDAARKASPHSDIAWLDQAAATEADAGPQAAGELVREQVLDRFDEDLPPRSEAVIEHREWGATG